MAKKTPNVAISKASIKRTLLQEFPQLEQIKNDKKVKKSIRRAAKALASGLKKASKKTASPTAKAPVKKQKPVVKEKEAVEA